MQKIDYKKVFFEFFLGLVFSIIGFFVFIGFHYFYPYFFQSEAIFYSGLFIGLPIGSFIGIFLTDKIIFYTNNWNTIGILLSIILSFLGGITGAYFYDLIGIREIMPIVVVLFSLIGYNLPYLLKRNSIN